MRHTLITVLALLAFDAQAQQATPAPEATPAAAATAAAPVAAVAATAAPTVAPAPVDAPAPVAAAAPASAPAPVATPAPAAAQAPVVVVPAPAAAPVVAAPAPMPVATPVMVAPAYASYPVYAAPQAVNPWMQYAPAPTFGFNPFMMMQMQPQAAPSNMAPYSMRRVVTQDEKKQLMQMALPMMTGMMGMKMPDSMNYFARKVKAKAGLSFDEVRDSLFLRANQLNVKKVGENLMWKDFQVVLEDKSAPRIEVYSFCDIAIGRELLKISPEFVVFLPCRIAVMEDANKEIWILMIDWNPEWVSGFRERLGITDALWKGAVDLYGRLNNMMEAAASGDI